MSFLQSLILIWENKQADEHQIENLLIMQRKACDAGYMWLGAEVSALLAQLDEKTADAGEQRLIQTNTNIFKKQAKYRFRAYQAGYFQSSRPYFSNIFFNSPDCLRFSTPSESISAYF